MNQCGDVDSYEIEEPSDEERAASSSEDELDVLLSGTPEQKKKLIREYLTGESESSSDDDFEKEMEAELSSTLRTLEDGWAPAHARAGGGSGGDGSTLANPAKPQMYDKIYFDSDSDEDVEPSGSARQRRLARRRVPTNDELLYDPDEDERDRAWVDARRRVYQGQRPTTCARSPHPRPKSLPSSDAVLNCPACMTTLCLDCQRHEKYRTQYRAMFVMNCSVNKEEVLRYKTLAARTPRNRKGKTTTAAAAPAGMDAGPDELYHPVQCSECSTEVAVLDKDEVYHFFNILSSHC